MSKKKKRQHTPATPTPSVTNQKHEDFADLYRSTDSEDSVDMTTLQRSHGRRSLIGVFVAIILGLSAVAAIMGYIVFGRNRLSVNPGEVTVDINAVTTVPSGDELTLTIHYQNNSPVTIDHGTVEIVYPDGFYFKSSDPTASQGDNHWDIDTLPAGAEGTITVKGQAVGQKGDDKDFTALLTYTPSNFSSDFQSSATHTLTLSDSILKLEVTLSDRARTGEELEYVYTLTNTATLPLVNVKAYLQYPDGYTPTSADPSAQQSNHTWLFTQIDPGQNTTVKVKGDVTAENDSTQEFVLQVGLQEPDGFFNLQGEDHHSVYIVNPELALTLAGPEHAQPGDDLEYTIEISNPSKVDISDIELQLEFNGDAVTTNKVELDTINDLPAGEKKELTYAAKVNEDLASTTTAITATLSVLNAKVADAAVEFDQTAQVETAVQGSITLNAEARYFDDDLSKLGSGPLPPVVGEATTYVIYLTVAAVGSGMEDVTVQSPLPNGVSFVRSSDDRITYDETSQTVTWAVKSLDPNETKVTSFKISVTPAASDLNKLLVLVNESIATATDSNSDTTVQAEAKKITSNLENDPGTADDGVVVAQ